MSLLHARLMNPAHEIVARCRRSDVGDTLSEVGRLPSGAEVSAASTRCRHVRHDLCSRE